MPKYTYSADPYNNLSGVVQAGHFHESDDYLIRRPGGIGDWIVTWTLDGEGAYGTPEGELVCRANDIVLLRPGTPHRYGTPKGKHWHFLWAHFPDMINETSLLPQQGHLHFAMDGTLVRQRLHRIFRTILDDFIERGPYWQELCLNSIREALLLVVRSNDKSIDPRIQETMHLLSRRLREPVRIAELARDVGLSASRLSHLFKQQIGRPIVEELNLMRLRQAELMLLHTHRSAFEIAAEVGYVNYNHFANRFKAQYGRSPRDYRSDHSPSNAASSRSRK